MTGILANHPDYPVTANDLAVTADFFYRSAYFHRILQIDQDAASRHVQFIDLVISLAQQTLALKTALLHQALILMRHQVRLNLGHEIHYHYYDNQQRGASKVEWHPPVQN